jgi:hypothetical protein
MDALTALAARRIGQRIIPRAERSPQVWILDYFARHRSGAASAVFFVRGVQDFVGDAQAFYRFAIHNVRFDDFVDVVGAHAAIKNAFRIDSDSRAELALIKAAGLIGAHELDTAPRKFHFEETLQFALSSGIAATARVTGLTLIYANKNVFPELWHRGFRYFQDTRNTRCDTNGAAP